MGLRPHPDVAPCRNLVKAESDKVNGMLHFLKSFRRDENGAVTVDWVVITASVVALAVAIVAAMQASTIEASETTGDYTAAMTEKWFGE